MGLLTWSRPRPDSDFAWFVVFALMSSALVPMDHADSAPVRPKPASETVIENIRGLLEPQPQASPWLALAWCGGLAVAIVLWSLFW